MTYRELSYNQRDIIDKMSFDNFRDITSYGLEPFNKYFLPVVVITCIGSITFIYAVIALGVIL